ncbi:Transglutaminase-like_superfamily protein [Hexamita inflata]|uniref:Transglutaminase-like superfamily protein n=1 Tax=Hexamita inflata TaxID=28002 RepID=A0AA86RP55_9EUKA|nr:Transglutaminase-like superfamily protein [Hexamita inflata]
MTKVFHYKLPSTCVNISNIVASEKSLQQSAIELAKLALNSKQIQFEIYNISLEKLIELINIQFIILRPLKDTLVVSGYNQSKNTIQFKTVPKSFIILQGINPINEIEQVLKNQNQYSFSFQFQTQNAVRSDNIADQIQKILQKSGTLAQIQVNNANQNIFTVEIQNIQQKINLNKNAHRYHKIFIPNQKVFDQIIAAACKLENIVQIDLKEEFTDTQFQAIYKIIKLDYPELFFIQHMTYTSWNDYINEIVIFTDNPKEIETKNKELTEEIQNLKQKQEHTILILQSRQFNLKRDSQTIYKIQLSIQNQLQRMMLMDVQFSRNVCAKDTQQLFNCFVTALVYKQYQFSVLDHLKVRKYLMCGT